MDFQSRQNTRTKDLSVEDAVLMLLHRTAQPLSTVRGILELTLAEAMTADEKKAWLQQAMEQLLQATSNFEQLRQLVETDRCERQSSEKRASAHV
jgi:nitrogen-specific signal transduction histidine kinase